MTFKRLARHTGVITFLVALFVGTLMVPAFLPMIPEGLWYGSILFLMFTSVIIGAGNSKLEIILPTTPNPKDYTAEDHEAYLANTRELQATPEPDGGVSGVGPDHDPGPERVR